MKKLTNSNRKIPNALLLPIILMIGFVPLIVHTFTYNTGLSQFDWYPDSAGTTVDVFFAWKMIAAIVLGVVMLGIILFRYYSKKEKLQFENAFYLLFFYALFVAMSALFSPYKYWVIRGTYELFESVWVVFAYIIVCYYTYNYVQEEKQVKLVLGWAGLGMLLVTIIGVFQYFALDFFKTSLGKHLITDPSFWDNLDAISFTMAPNTSYTTLYNPNYLSFFFGMMIPLVACLIVASRKLIHRILLIVVELLALICLKGSGSDSGWLAIIIGVAIVVFVLLSRTKKTLFAGIGLAVAGAVAIVVVGTATPLGTRLAATFAGTYHMNERFALWDVETNDENVILDIQGNKLVLSYTTSDVDGTASILCTDENGTALAKTLVDEANQIEQLDDPIYAGCQIQPLVMDDMLCIRAMISGGSWDFVHVPNDGYYYANAAGKLVKYESVNTVGLFREDAFSGRGHIWNNTIPLLGKHILLGVGANAYMLAYPQDDYLYRTYVFYGNNNYDVKAHCWYLQQWVENGLIGLLLLLGFLGWYAVRSARIYRRANLKESLTWVGLGLFAAIVVYMVAAIANDSNVCTAPVFWGLLGLGMAVNRIVAEKQELFVVADEDTDINSKAEMQSATGVAASQTSTAAGTTNGASASPANGKKKSSKKKSKRERMKENAKK